MTAKVTIHANTTSTPYTVTISDGHGHQWLADEPAEAGGADAGPSPGQLMLSSLGACTLITLQMFAARKAWPLAGAVVELELNPDGKPAAGGTVIRRNISLTGVLNAEQQARLLQVANACPMHKLLTGEVVIDTLLDL
ncbi:OsmC family protein [Cupriavidus necator]|uniref:OsmC family protein n=1 Tax=Cupriavidus necator TaxID=106590 RepID=A0A1K0IKN4_CUPNE|nr:OsmC family protein [Cupriavidus necator]